MCFVNESMITPVSKLSLVATKARVNAKGKYFEIKSIEKLGIINFGKLTLIVEIFATSQPE